MNYNKIILELFKSIICDNDYTPNEKALKYGVYITNKASDDLIDEAIKLYGKQDFNKTFHKSFQTVIDTDIDTLMFQQIIHYLTTYGFEKYGIYNEETVYIPKEELNVPELSEDIELVYIRCISTLELSNKLEDLLTSSIALNTDTLDKLLDLSEYIAFDIDTIKNKDFRLMLYDKLGKVPNNPLEFLKYLVFKLTGYTYLIKNRDMKTKLLKDDNGIIYDYLNKFTEEFTDFSKLAPLVNRYGYIFICLRRHYNIKKSDKDLCVNNYINKLMKKGKHVRKHTKINILDKLTALNSLEELEKQKSSILEELDNITIYHEIRLLNSLIYRENIDDVEDTVYRVRNGKIYVQPITVNNKEVLIKLNDMIYRHLIRRIALNVEDKSYYINSFIDYGLPTSEKNYVGHLPEGTTITLPKDHNLIVAVYWHNTSDGSRVDLDLHLKNRLEEYGWNTSYRSDEADIVYSGDITDGADGATEAYLISNKLESSSYLLTLNDFTCHKQTLDFDFIIAWTDDKSISENYILDPNKILCRIPMKMDKNIIQTNEMTLGVICIEDNIKFYFSGLRVSQKAVSTKEQLSSIYNYLDKSNATRLKLQPLLDRCEAVYCNEKTCEQFIPVEVDGDILYKKVQKQVDFDLDINSIDKATIIKILKDK